MFSLSEFFLGPLTQETCVYFLFLTIIFLILLLFTLFTEILYIIKNFRHMNIRMFSNTILLLCNLFLGYFVNRLFYTMCSKSLN